MLDYRFASKEERKKIDTGLFTNIYKAKEIKV